MATRKAALLAGAQDIAPLLLGALPFALIAGLSAVRVGLSKGAALAMSHIVFAGAAQLAIVDLLARDTSVLVIVFTALVINLRFSVYSASLAPHFHDLPLYWRAGLAYLLTDQSFAISITAFNQGRNRYKHWYYLGGAGAMWGVWHLGTALGVFLGTQIPETWALDFAIPLTFLALLFAALKDRCAVVAAGTSGLLALVCRPLPYNLGLFVATIGGIIAGYIASGRWSDDP